MDAAQWDERYGQGRVWSVEPNRFFADLVESLPEQSGRAIDLACGEGRNAVWLASLGWEVTAVDFSQVGVETGRREAEAAGVAVDWVVGDLRETDLLDQQWDLVCHVYLHWPAAQREPFLLRCADAVAPGGHLIVVGHDRDNIENGHGGPQDPDVLTTPEEMRSLFDNCGLETLRAETVRRSVTLEPGHGQPSEPINQTAVVDAIDHVVLARRTPNGQ